jgi:hypothetical protein
MTCAPLESCDSQARARHGTDRHAIISKQFKAARQQIDESIGGWLTFA